MRRPILDRQLRRLLPLCTDEGHKSELRRIHHQLMKKNGCERKHDAMTLTAAYFLLRAGNTVKVEYPLPSAEETLYADIYAEKDGVARIYEVELFAYRGNFVRVPGTKLFRRLSKAEYFADRIIGKVARYWPYAEELYLIYSMDNAERLKRYAEIFEFFQRPMGERGEREIHDLAVGAENVYVHPKIPEERIRSARLGGVWAVDISRIAFEPMGPFVRAERVVQKDAT